MGRQRLAGYTQVWLATRTDLRPRTTELYQRLLRLHILPELGQLPLKSLTAPIVRARYLGLGSSTGETSRGQAYRLLRTIINQAVRDGEISKNPCQIRSAGTPETTERPIPILAQVHELAETPWSGSSDRTE